MGYNYKEQLIEEINFINDSLLLKFSSKIKGRYDAYVISLKTFEEVGTNRSLFTELMLNEILYIKRLLILTKMQDEIILYSGFNYISKNIFGFKSSNTKYLTSKMNTLINLLIDYLDVCSEK